jgi:hypothetical protein
MAKSTTSWTKGKAIYSSFAVLEATCKLSSGVTRRFELWQHGKNRVRIYYSNPDEYGNEFPIWGEYPVVFDKFVNDLVVFDYLLRVGGGRDKYDKDSYVDVVLDVWELVKDVWFDPGKREFVIHKG